jgi:uncharacterized membrane protein
MGSDTQYLPLTPGLFSILVFLVIGLLILIQLGILRYAYMRLGVGPGAALLLLFGSLIGSYFNIPITFLPGETVRAGETINFFGMQYVVPVVVWLKGATATAVVAFIIHEVATPVPGLGIAVPVFVPAVATAIIAFILSREHAPPLAYVGGSMGTLIGADLLNLDKITSLGAPVASIGGAGTFDGIFLTGILAVLLAGIVSPSRPRPAW